MNWADLSLLAREYWVVWLMLVVAAIAFHAFRPKNREHFEDCARIPFRGDDEERSNHG